MPWLPVSQLLRIFYFELDPNEVLGCIIFPGSNPQEEKADNFQMKRRLGNKST
jgi:hypothetical protein